MKLNNKAFAISSMLYGILAITIILLASILSIMRSNHTANQDLSYTVSDDLNKCAKRQLLMNNCYLESEDCDLERSNYNSCIGVKDSAITTVGVSPSTLSAGLLASGVVKMIKLGETDYYVFQGTNPNNYITYEGKKGRIIYFETNGNMKVIFDNVNIAPTTIMWDEISDKNDAATMANLWTGSKIHYYLNNDFLNTFTDISKFNDRAWAIGNLYNSASFYGANGYFERERLETATHKVGLPSISDVLISSSNQHCLLDEKLDGRPATTNCTSNNWLLNSNVYMWLSNGVADSNRNKVETYAYAINNEGLQAFLKNNTTLQVRPVIYFSQSNIKNNTTGTINNPYEIN